MFVDAKDTQISVSIIICVDQNNIWFFIFSRNQKAEYQKE
jgi:hypothetical protein